MGVNNGGVGGPQSADEISSDREPPIETRDEFVGESVAIAKQDFPLRILEAWVRAPEANHNRAVAAEPFRLFSNEGLALCEKSFAKNKSSLHNVRALRKYGAPNKVLNPERI